LKHLVWMLMDEKRNQCLACSLYNKERQKAKRASQARPDVAL